MDGQPLRTTADGRFIVGVGRDAPETATLQVTAPDGTAETRTLTVDRREYRIQRIDGIAKEYVSPPEAVLARIRADAEAAAAARATDRPETDFESGFVCAAAGPNSGVYGSQRLTHERGRANA